MEHTVGTHHILAHQLLVAIHTQRQDPLSSIIKVVPEEAALEEEVHEEVEVEEVMVGEAILQPTLLQPQE